MTTDANKPYSTKSWTVLLDQCLQERIPSEQFSTFVKVLAAKSLPSSMEISRLMLRANTSSHHEVDPLIPLYIEQLWSAEILKAYDIMAVLLKQFQSRLSAVSDVELERALGQDTAVESTKLEEVLLTRIATMYSHDSKLGSIREARRMLSLLAGWMSAMLSASTARVMHGISEAFYQPAPQTLMAREALGSIFISVVHDARMIQVMELGVPEQIGKSIAQGLSAFIQLLTNASPQVAYHLDAIQKSYPALQNQEALKLAGHLNADIGFGELQLSSIVDGPFINSRAGLYIYLEALLVGAPLTNDYSITNYLQTRYKGDMQILVIDLVVASFDVLHNALNRGDSMNNLFVPRSFLVNKIPGLLLSLSSFSFVPLNYEILISQALNRLDPIFSLFSDGLGLAVYNGTLADTREDFLLACALNGLIEEHSIERLVGGSPMRKTLSSRKRTKDALVAEYSKNLHKLEQLVQGLEAMDGSVAATAEATTLIFHNLCKSRDTMALKSLCNHLSKRHLALDALLLFCSPGVLLQPLCQLLDEWKHEQDHGEFQPMYDEFSACLLLLMTFVYRFKLTITELGVSNKEGFVARLLTEGGTSKPIKNLSDVQNKHLAGWIRGLFETEGISDDLMSACGPQDFYLLVATLVDHAMVACRSNLLRLEAFMNGLELLLEPFLIPSLVLFIKCLIGHAWEGRGDWELLLQVFSKLIRPASLHGDALAMHSTVLSIVGQPLKHALLDLRRRVPAMDDIGFLIEQLQPYLLFVRTLDSHPDELQAFCTNHNGSILIAVKNSIRSLCYWSTPTTSSSTMPEYTYRILHAAIQSCGATRTLRALVNEIKLQIADGCGDVALDIVTSCVCASSIRNKSVILLSKPSVIVGRGAFLSLRDALQLELEDAAKIILIDRSRAEILVWLDRRVEAQLSNPTVMDMQMGLPDIIGNIDFPSAQDLASTSAEMPMSFPTAEDIATASEAGLLNFDMAVNSLPADVAPQNAQPLDLLEGFENIPQSATDDDIFSGLDLDADIDMS